ncbi:hypothetical protein FSP39_020634 [Pinctada imbricata]|uniref:Uncharacterized protein n=1 Tax=Pinctada imbricata TaxID=66713 RepID=A0AA88YQJ6_PINIB|nr:hypothetical protein FSP39_020634 [Pinctada imbricata]
MDQNKEGVSHWTIKAQQMIINAQNPSVNIHISNSERNFAALEFAHPSATFKNNDVSISTYTTVSLPFNPLDVTTGPQSPSQLQAKMKSQDAVKSKAQNSAFSASATCKEINQAAFQYAMSLSSTDAVRRYRASGRQLSFLDDRQTSNGPQWLMENLVLNYNSTGLTVLSPTLKTDLHVLFSSFAGQTYCKLLSPYRAMEYIYIDSMAPVS